MSCHTKRLSQLLFYWLLRILCQRYLQHQQDLYHVFISILKRRLTEYGIKPFGLLWVFITSTPTWSKSLKTCTTRPLVQSTLMVTQETGSKPESESDKLRVSTLTNSFQHLSGENYDWRTRRSPRNRLLARILKVGVQILCGPKAHIAWRLRRHAPRGFGGHAPQENFEKLKRLRRDFRNSDSCKRLSIYLLNRCFSLKALLSYPFLNLPCLTLNYIWDRNSSCYEEWLKFEVVKPWFTRKNRYAWLCWSNCILVYKCQSPNLRNATSFIIFSKEL